MAPLSQKLCYVMAPLCDRLQYYSIAIVVLMSVPSVMVMMDGGSEKCVPRLIDIPLYIPYLLLSYLLMLHHITIPLLATTSTTIHPADIWWTIV